MNYISSLNTSNLQQPQVQQDPAQVQLQLQQQIQQQQQQQQQQDNYIIRSKSIPLSSASETDLKNLIISSTTTSINNHNHKGSSIEIQLDSNKMSNSQYTTDGQNMAINNNLFSPRDTSTQQPIATTNNQSSAITANTTTTNTTNTSASASNIQQLTSQAAASANPTTASLFFHNPFDTTSYPVTNPPIFDSTVMLPYYSNDGVPRRRRISISNGQIGQIINHEAFFDDENPSNPLFDDDEFVFANQQPPLPAFNNNSQQQQQQPQLQQPFQQQQQQQQQQQLHFPQQQIPQQPLLAHNDASTLPIIPLKQDENKAQLSPADPLANAAGVPPPNHQLIYNNEVIFNANNGPIPGTAAWKKERLLERNRVAASKCRQRKKQAHLQLQDNVGKMERQLVEKHSKISTYEKLFKKYNSALSAYFENGGTELSELKKFINIKKIEDANDLL